MWVTQSPLNLSKKCVEREKAYVLLLFFSRKKRWGNGVLFLNQGCSLFSEKTAKFWIYVPVFFPFFGWGFLPFFGLSELYPHCSGVISRKWTSS